MQLSPGQDDDGPYRRELLESFQPGPVANVVGHPACDGDETREQIRRLKAAACVNPHASGTSGKRFDKNRCRDRNQGEPFFSHIKRFRRVATGYGKTV